MANDDITWVRPEHRAASAAWRKCRDFCKGAEAVKAAGNKYLPYLDPTDKSTRNRKRNEDYLSRAVFYAIAGNTKIGMLGMAALDGYTFRYKDADSKRLTAGALAQDLDLVIPDLVIHDEATDYLVADYMGLIGYLIAAVKGLKLQIDEIMPTDSVLNREQQRQQDDNEG
ncbi:hypothetical protein QLG21_11910 [Enterobacter sp. V87_3]|nr:hypothetical protein [Enterobacter sp. V87_3]MDI3426703.1 hypothetical protein [Enterobacter sp. V87_3]